MSQSTVPVSLCALGFSFISTASYATAIQVDFGGRDWLGYQNSSASTGNWNNYRNPGSDFKVADAIDFQTGLTTGISFSASGTGTTGDTNQWASNIDTNNGWTGVSGEWVTTAASADNFYTKSSRYSGNSIIKITGLNSAATYKLELVASDSSFGSEYAAYSVVTSSAAAALNQASNYSSTHLGINTTATTYIDDAYTAGTSTQKMWNSAAAQTTKDWMIWDSLQSSVSGELYISIGGQYTDGFNYDVGYINALNLVTVPAPSVVSILAFGMGRLITRRRCNA